MYAIRVELIPSILTIFPFIYLLHIDFVTILSPSFLEMESYQDW